MEGPDCEFPQEIGRFRPGSGRSLLAPRLSSEAPGGNVPQVSKAPGGPGEEIGRLWQDFGPDQEVSSCSPVVFGGPGRQCSVGQQGFMTVPAGIQDQNHLPAVFKDAFKFVLVSLAPGRSGGGSGLSFAKGNPPISARIREVSSCSPVVLGGPGAAMFRRSGRMSDRSGWGGSEAPGSEPRPTCT